MFACCYGNALNTENIPASTRTQVLGPYLPTWEACSGWETRSYPAGGNLDSTVVLK